MFDTSWLKVSTFFGIWTIIWLPLAIVISRLIGWQPGKPLEIEQKLILLASLYLLSPIVLLWEVKTEGLSFDSLGLSFQVDIFISILSGLFLSLTSLIIIFVLESFFNLVDWHWSNYRDLVKSLLPILVLSLFISGIEEIIFRGYVFSTLAEDYSSVFAAAISSCIFALLHLIWERKETIPQIPGLWLMGMVLVVARIVDGNDINLAIGLHAGWIWGLTSIDSANLLTYKKENSWLTGLNKQPLAGIAGISCLVLVGSFLWFLYQNIELIR